MLATTKIEHLPNSPNKVE
ncbi:hypothetical protein SAMN02745203_01332 [Porphyromonas crevioricanis]|nr:hypothetical protein SAMN02745203_01332 [Porphyromonas crevioricanis]